MNPEEVQVIEKAKEVAKGNEKPHALVEPATGRLLLRRVLLPIGAGILTGLTFYYLQRWEEEREDPETPAPEETDHHPEATARAVWWLPLIRLGSTLLKTYVEKKISEAQEDPER